jgi:hypothetical protein
MDLKLNKKSMKYLLIRTLTFIGLSLVFVGCTNFPTFPSSTPSVIKFGEPSSFACFTKHNGTQKIKLWVNIVCRIFDGQRRVDFGTKNVTIDPSTTSFPFDIPFDLPANGRFELEATVHGEDCSECANGASAFDEIPYANCAYFVNNTTPPTTRSAKPRWNGTLSFANYQSVININGISRILNVPNSCGCSVPW